MMPAVRVIGMVVIVALVAGPLYAGEADQVADNNMSKNPIDCRYGQADGETTSEIFPSDDVFRPLLADPKQPQWFAMWQSTRSRSADARANFGSVGIGENFGFYTRRQGCDGWQVNLLTGIFSQFNLDTTNAALVNIDFNVGVPLTWRSGNWSARFRYYHQSSHLGDEFLGLNPGFQSINLQYEEVDMILSYDLQKWLRLYGGGGVMVNRIPATIDRNQVQWGFEARAPLWRSHVFGRLSNPVIVSPILSADFKSNEELNWIINTNVLWGIEISPTASFKRVRILMNFYHGFFPYGQFFYTDKVQSFGVGAYFMF
jgi:hypothetical protein